MPSIDEIANAWAVRWDAGVLDATQKQELEAWLAMDRRHRGAYLRARATLQWIDQAREPDAADAADPIVIPAAAYLGSKGVSRGWGIAFAGIAAAVGAFVLWPSPPDYATAIGQHRDVMLADGSLAALNTDTALDVDYSASRRDLALRKGEAWFRVAHNRARPFEVTVGSVHVRATGTAFAVRSVDEGVRVTVTEGRVLAWIDGSAHKPIAIAMGDQAFLRQNGTKHALTITEPSPAGTDIEQTLAWRRGEIVLNGQTGSEAADEFNRYNERPIRIRNARAARYQLVGYFQTSQSLEFATALARISGSRLSSNRNEIIIE
ncbi:FecR family protein [Novosphingobium kaempferiae]|uniref:FecR family protein n=1 Tax=Novosphingobium kaempferiae TaxID=2896849 RepID=UPI001E3DCFB0|nr:FecR domain-containing protein [Novosphingobium kaempferiae]